MGIVNQQVTSYNYQYIEIEFDFIPSYAILNFYLISNKDYNFYGNVIIFKEESPAAWTDYSYYKLGKDNNLIFKNIKLNNNILSIRQSSLSVNMPLYKACLKLLPSCKVILC